MEPATPPAVPATPPATAPSTPQPTAASIRTQINDDVVYIITDAERKAYKELKTDDERKKFAEQFQLRRNQSNPVFQLAQDSQSTPAPQALPTPWDKWLNEDVAYIITDAERKAFKELQTDDERNQFVEQFWLRRDPTPATAENEFKVEHYRRIAYANGHFGSQSSVPGWKTDRGRIYIVFGPPDEIDAHPSGGDQSTTPFQDWRYRYIDNIGNDVKIEFVDKDKNGEYHMTMDPSGKDAIKYVRPR